MNALVWDTTKVLKSFNCEILIYMVGHMGRQSCPGPGARIHSFYNMPDYLKYGTSQCSLRRRIMKQLMWESNRFLKIRVIEWAAILVNKGSYFGKSVINNNNSFVDTVPLQA